MRVSAVVALISLLSLFGSFVKSEAFVRAPSFFLVSTRGGALPSGGAGALSEGSVAKRPAAQAKTLIIIKPDAVQRGLVGAIISRFEARGYEILQMKVTTPNSETVDKHYKDHLEQPFFPPLKSFFLSGPVCCLVVGGPPSVVPDVRALVGATSPAAAGPGTIRKEFGETTMRNAVHASESEEMAKREIDIWFEGGDR